METNSKSKMYINIINWSTFYLMLYQKVSKLQMEFALEITNLFCLPSSHLLSFRHMKLFGFCESLQLMDLKDKHLKINKKSHIKEKLTNM